MNEDRTLPKKETLKILIVEDDHTVGELVQGTLQDMKHDVSWKTSAEDALRLLASTTPEKGLFDVIYLDIQLPKLDGIEFCKMCREYRHPLNPTKPLAHDAWIIAMTSLGQINDVMEMLSAGANDYMTKPITPKIIEVKTTVCLFSTERIRAFRARIQNMEKQLVEIQQLHLGVENPASQKFPG